MSPLVFTETLARARLGVKGPRASAWLLEQGVTLPDSANSWLNSPDDAGNAGDADGLLIARLGYSEFFLEHRADGGQLRCAEASLAAGPAGVYPVLREDSGFSLSGDGSHEVLAQVCSFDFTALAPGSRAVIMTMMIGVGVLIVPDQAGGGRRHRIWCDPSFGEYLGSTLGSVVMEYGGKFTGVSA